MIPSRFSKQMINFISIRRMYSLINFNAKGNAFILKNGKYTVCSNRSYTQWFLHCCPCLPYTVCHFFSLSLFPYIFSLYYFSFSLWINKSWNLLSNNIHYISFIISIPYGFSTLFRRRVQSRRKCFCCWCCISQWNVIFYYM